MSTSNYWEHLRQQLREKSDCDTNSDHSRCKQKCGEPCEQMNDLKRKPTVTDPRKVLNASKAQSHPPCFEDAKQYRDWMWLNRQARQSTDTSYCLDCTPEFKERMLNEGKCSHPETRFVVWSSRSRELEVIGVSNESIFWNRVQRGITIMNWGDTYGEDQQQG